MIFDTLRYIGEEFNKKECLWGLGASMVLNHYGLIDNPNDIDILVHIKDIEKVDEILKNLGEKKLREKIGTYSTKYFYEYVVNGVDIDVMAGFIINHERGSYEYIFDNDSIIMIKTIKGVDIPLTSLEDWYVLYQLIPGRENKVKIIENYLLEHGVEHKNLLNRALTNSLPNRVRERAEKFLSLYGTN